MLALSLLLAALVAISILGLMMIEMGVETEHAGASVIGVIIFALSSTGALFVVQAISAQ